MNPQTKVLVMAHRGFSSRFPENTILAFREALKVGADGFECDLMITKDGRVISFHDETLTRLCGVRGRVEEKTWDDLKNLKVLGREPIATLEQIYELFSHVPINFEIKKSTRYREVVDHVYQLLKGQPQRGKIYLSSFDKNILNYAKQVDQASVFSGLGALYPTQTWKTPFARFQLGETFEYYSANVPSTFLEKLPKNEAKLKTFPPLWVWTLNTPEEWQAALDSKARIEAIITDYPDLLRFYLDSR